MAGKKILIVDPDRQYASRLAAAMVAEEYDVVIATDAVQGFEVFRTQAPDLVIASLQLPGGGGIQVHQRIKRIGKVTLPVVYLADPGDGDLRDEARALGAAAILERPVHTDDLLAVASELLKSPRQRSRGLSKSGALRVLVVDGDPDDRDRVGRDLNAPGRESVHVTFAHTVEEALRLVREFRYDCVLLAHRLPDGWGLDVLEQGDEYLLTTPVIGLGGADDPAIAVGYFRAGCIEFLHKKDVLHSDMLRRNIARAIATYQRRVMAALIERRQLGDAIDKSQEGLITLARTDRLTGICNRAVFDEYQPTYHEEVAERGGSYALGLVGLDRFDAYNNHYGHAAGDEVIRTLAETLTSSLREDDFIARYGGAKMVVLLDAATAQTVGVVTDRLLRRILDHQIPHGVNSPYDRVTVSIGVGLFDPEAPSTAIAVLVQADEALYQARHAGGNRVIIGPAEPVSPRMSA